MNKMMVFPMAFMFLLTAFAIVGSSIHYTANYTYKTPTGQTTENFDIWSIGVGAGVILTAALAAAIIMGFNFFGTGFNSTSQIMTFNAILYGGLWAGLSVVSSRFLFSNLIISLFWIILTFLYVIGLGQQMAAAGGSPE